MTTLKAALNSKAVTYGVAVVVGGTLLYFAARQLWPTLRDVNKGTPYEGTGAIGTLGNVVNQASGGLLERFGGWLGRSIYDLTHAEYDPNATVSARDPEKRNDPHAGGLSPTDRAARAASPVRPEDKAAGTWRFPLVFRR